MIPISLLVVRGRKCLNPAQVLTKHSENGIYDNIADESKKDISEMEKQ